MGVEDGDEGVIVGDNGEVHAGEEHVAFVNGPRDGQQLEFDDCVP